jgi:tRNA-dihydrouridine synthase
MREHTGCAGIMIARGSHGAPWVFGQARAALDGRAIPPAPDVAERFAIVLEHARNAITFKHEVAAVHTDEALSETFAMREFRKHLGWYTKGLPNGKALREELFGVSSLADAARILEGYLAAALTPAAA